MTKLGLLLMIYYKKINIQWDKTYTSNYESINPYDFYLFLNKKTFENYFKKNGCEIDEDYFKSWPSLFIIDNGMICASKYACDYYIKTMKEMNDVKKKVKNFQKAYNDLFN